MKGFNRALYIIRDHFNIRLLDLYQEDRAMGQWGLVAEEIGLLNM